MTVSKRFKMPGTRSGAANHEHQPNGPFWYSFDYGSVHFTIISTEHDLSHSSEQYKVWRVQSASKDAAHAASTHEAWHAARKHRQAVDIISP